MKTVLLRPKEILDERGRLVQYDRMWEGIFDFESWETPL